MNSNLSRGAVIDENPTGTAVDLTRQSRSTACIFDKIASNSSFLIDQGRRTRESKAYANIITNDETKAEKAKDFLFGFLYICQVWWIIVLRWRQQSRHKTCPTHTTGKKVSAASHAATRKPYKLGSNTQAHTHGWKPCP